MYKSTTVALMVADIERSLRFYTEALGFTLIAPDDHFAQVQGPGVVIGLHVIGTNEPTPARSNAVSLGFEVDRLEPTMAALKGKGVQFGPNIIDVEKARLATFADPDGHMLYLVEAKGA